MTEGVPALLARLMTEPDLLDALERRDLATLRRELTAQPADLAVIAAIDVSALRYYLRLLQRKRVDNIEPIFRASLSAASGEYGMDAVTDGFWQWYQPSAALAADEVLAEDVTQWTRFAGHLARRGPLGWLGDLSRYEAMRWRAVFFAAPPEAPHRHGQEGRGKPVLCSGAGLATFAVDVPVLLRTAMNGTPTALPATTRLITWSHPAGGIRTARLGLVAYEAIRACDGDRTVAEIAEMVSAGREDGEPRIAAALRDLIRAGALCLSTGDRGAAEHHNAGLVQLPDGA